MSKDRPYRREPGDLWQTGVWNIEGPDGFSVALPAGAARVLERLNAQHARINELEARDADQMIAEQVTELERCAYDLHKQQAEIDRLTSVWHRESQLYARAVAKLEQAHEGLRRAGELLYGDTGARIASAGWRDQVTQWRDEYLREDGE